MIHEIMAARTCRCCGEKERDSGCVRGLACGCHGAECDLCRYCLTHCRCAPAMKADYEAARLKFRQEVYRLRDLYKAVVNKRV